MVMKQQEIDEKFLLKPGNREKFGLSVRVWVQYRVVMTFIVVVFYDLCW